MTPAAPPAGSSESTGSATPNPGAAAQSPQQAALDPGAPAWRRYATPFPIGDARPRAIVADTGWHWMIDRADVLWKAPWPRPSVAGLAILALWLAGILLAAGGLSVVAKRLRFAPGNAVPLPQRGVPE